jgi:hypothetical protein
VSKLKKPSRAAKTPAPSPWSPRSQRSVKREYELEKEIGKFQALIQFEVNRLQVAETNRLRQAKLVSGGQHFYMAALEDSLKEITERKGKIASFEETISGLRREIEALQPTAPQAAERRRKQSELAALTESRKRGDELIDLAIEQLRGLLIDRVKLTQKMLQLASEIDFTGDGDFDSARFNRLLSSLPSAMRRDSAQWVEWFLGREQGRSACEIREETQTFPETLAAAHFYRCGERPLLTEKQQAVLNTEKPHVLTSWEIEQQVMKPKETEPDSRYFPGSGILV